LIAVTEKVKQNIIRNRSPCFYSTYSGEEPLDSVTLRTINSVLKNHGLGPVPADNHLDLGKLSDGGIQSAIYTYQQRRAADKQAADARGLPPPGSDFDVDPRPGDAYAIFRPAKPKRALLLRPKTPVWVVLTDSSSCRVQISPNAAFAKFSSNGGIHLVDIPYPVVQAEFLTSDFKADVIQISISGLSLVFGNTISSLGGLWAVIMELFDAPKTFKKDVSIFHANLLILEIDF